MPGRAGAHDSALAIDETGHRGDEAPVWQLACESLAGRAHEGPQVGRDVGLSLDRVPGSCRQADRVDTLAGDVAHQHERAGLAQVEHVVEVSSHMRQLGGRGEADSDIEAVHGRRNGREKRRLNSLQDGLLPLSRLVTEQGISREPAGRLHDLRGPAETVRTLVGQVERSDHPASRTERENREGFVQLFHASSTESSQLVGGEVLGESADPAPGEGAALRVEGEGSIDGARGHSTADALGAVDHRLVAGEGVVCAVNHASGKPGNSPIFLQKAEDSRLASGEGPSPAGEMFGGVPERAGLVEVLEDGGEFLEVVHGSIVARSLSENQAAAPRTHCAAR